MIPILTNLTECNWFTLKVCCTAKSINFLSCFYVTRAETLQGAVGSKKIPWLNQTILEPCHSIAHTFCRVDTLRHDQSGRTKSKYFFPSNNENCLPYIKHTC